jgi:threonine/homoserine/homoserine lactone efflux protein
MTLALTLGLSIGVKKTLWMMFGEVLGVALVAIFAVLGVALAMIKFPLLFIAIKTLGALYLLYLGINMWRSKGKLSLSLNAKPTIKISKISLFNQGFFTAIANPKGWAFMIALLPPFINKNQALPLQLSVLVFIIMLSEFICMLIYAKGGSTIGRLIKNQKNVALMNKVSGSLMIGVSFWLALS